MGLGSSTALVATMSRRTAVLAGFQVLAMTLRSGHVGVAHLGDCVAPAFLSN